jgi:hypothetical protein
MVKKVNISAFDSQQGTAGMGSELSGQGRKDRRRHESRIFYSVAVVDFISNPVEDLALNPVNDPDITYSQSLERGVNKVTNPSYVSRMPRNSIIGIRTNDRFPYGATGGTKQYEIFFPFFSPHLSLPVKPGEEVWVIYENAGTPEGIGYWMTRKSSSIEVDDINYTHTPRETLSLRKTESPETSSIIAFEGNDIDESYNPMGFPLGGGRVKANNLIPDIEGISAFEYIVDNSNAYQTQFTSEPVPRFSKRSPDFTLQGSNNTLICLGEERGRNSASDAAATTIPVKVAGDPDLQGRGAIDIVAGRSVLLKALTKNETVRDADTIYTTSEALTIDSETGFIAKKLDTSANPTLPAAVGKNSREKDEIDKTPIVTESNTDGDNIAEGDPDFINDLSRIYISMKTSVDENFEIETSDTAMAMSDGDVPGIVIKSDQVRIVAREDVKFMVGPADDGAAIVLKADGNIVFIPGASGVIKLGGDDADKGILCTGIPVSDVGDSTGVVVPAGPLGSTSAGFFGHTPGGPFGQFATKVVVK